jgi:hypothetical protein
MADIHRAVFGQLFQYSLNGRVTHIITVNQQRYSFGFLHKYLLVSYTPNGH